MKMLCHFLSIVWWATYLHSNTAPSQQNCCSAACCACGGGYRILIRSCRKSLSASFQPFDLQYHCYDVNSRKQYHVSAIPSYRGKTTMSSVVHDLYSARRSRVSMIPFMFPEYYLHTIRLRSFTSAMKSIGSLDKRSSSLLFPK